MTHEFFEWSADVITPSDLQEIRGYREAPLPDAEGVVESTPLDAAWQDLISARAYEFIVGWETGGRAYYEQVIKSRPVWPEYFSGITIGCGYDLGYQTFERFHADWEGRLSRAAMDRLSPTIGFRTDEPGRAAKVAQAHALVASLRDITIPWDVAIRQFDDAKMPRLIADLYRGLDNLDRLHPHARGALLSLVFNRGTGGFRSAKDRFREMVEIRGLMTSGRAQDLAGLPALLRSMTRIWGASSSLSKRRRQEAELFEAGLAEQRLTEGVAGLAALPRQETPEHPAEDHEDGPNPTDVTEESELDVLEAPGLSVANVRWNLSDDDQPDYRHIAKPGAHPEFDLTAEDIETLIHLNAFSPLPGRLVFALRGARIVGADKREAVTSVTLADQRPDHRDFRCVVGVLDRDTGLLWAYKASTVPEAKAVVICVTRSQQGATLSGNILATGCYTYTVGTHRANTSGEIRGVLRLSQTANGASRVIVLRSLSDLVYDRRDFWHDCTPADNIHPGLRNHGFSSLGCLTLPGGYHRASRTHTGLWADFRVALGMGAVFSPQDDGRQFSVILLTGLEAALVSSLRQAGQGGEAGAGKALMRLRFGSTGPAVARLQEQLGLAPDASRKIGPVTLGALIKAQQQRLGWADGVLSPETEADLGLSVFA